MTRGQKRIWQEKCAIAYVMRYDTADVPDNYSVIIGNMADDQFDAYRTELRRLIKHDIQ